MHLFSPQRPEASPGRKALLLDGSAIPTFTAAVTETGAVELSVLLREHTSGALFSYSHHNALLEPSELSSFFRFFYEDPEGALSTYFDWTALRASAKAKAKAETTLPTTLHDTSDLL